MDNKLIYIIGAGGHALSVYEVAKSAGYNVLGFFDDNIDIGTNVVGNIKVIDKIRNLENYKEKCCNFAIGIGNNIIRKHISKKFNVNFPTIIHPTAVIGSNVIIGNGTVIMARVCININSNIGDFCILNTGCIVEHENIIENYVHLACGVVLSGVVHIGELVLMGAGSKAIQCVSICNECVVGAGGLVIKDLTESRVYKGVPVK